MLAPAASRPSSVEWCIERHGITAPWSQQALSLSTADMAAPNALHVRWPNSRWASHISLRFAGHHTDMTPLAQVDTIKLPLSNFSTKRLVAPAPLTLVSRLGTFTVANVQQAWTVAQVNCLEELDGDTLSLHLRWRETGRATNRLIKIYNNLQVALYTEEIEPAAAAATARLTPEQVTPGQYSVEFCGNDTADQTTRTYCIPINVLGIDRLLQGRRIRIQSVHTSEANYQLKQLQFNIQVIGRITTGNLPKLAQHAPAVVKAINEGWYIGTLSVREGPIDRTKEYVDNPIKFEFDSTQNMITAIEDNTGDGAIFCPVCGRLFWTRSMERSERRQRHKPTLITNFALKITTREETSSPAPRLSAADRYVP
jgi:hypothetical protein